MFDCCLAPDTNGDGTGCDNMTCTIVVFKDLKSTSTGAEQTSKKRKAETDVDSTEDESEPKRPREDVAT